uniref:Uncharacterized protein n=1 Tax=Pipistrellus kuhlii TaxID=59472 RepID=A0A7J7TW39_PIPKU|nr:hypothetical protein mPipKuh1_009261 [Pipistrellus kuhlii]
MASPLTATHTRALDVDNQLLGPGPPHVKDPLTVRPVTAKDTLTIQVDSLALPMTGLDPLQDNTMGLAMASHETVLHTLAPMEGTEHSMGTLTTPRDTQTLMQEQARDIVIDGPQTPLDSQSRIMQTHPLRDSTAQPVVPLDRAQEEDTSPSMASPLTATHTRALDVDNQLLGPGPPHVGDPPAVRPATAKGTLAIQVDSLARPMIGLDPLQDNIMGPPMDNLEIALSTRGPMKGQQPATASPNLPMVCQDLAVHIYRDTSMNRQVVAPETQEIEMEIVQLNLFTVGTMDSILFRPVRPKLEYLNPVTWDLYTDLSMEKTFQDPIH